MGIDRIWDWVYWVVEGLDIQISRISRISIEYLSVYLSIIYLYLSICDDLCGWGMGMRFREICLSTTAGMGQRFV